MRERGGIKRRKTPQEKKANEYAKDHLVTGFEASYRVARNFRKSWPRQKVHAGKAYRRATNQRLHAQAAQGDTSSNLPYYEPIRRRMVRKWPGSITPLGKVVEERIEKRVIGSAQDFFWYDYESDRDCARFSAFLQSRVGGRTAKSRLLAFYLRDLMEPSNEGRWADNEWLSEKGQQWLRAFFRDEPEWEARVRAWIDSFDDPGSVGSSPE
jgi:hypothetical protein